MLLAHFPDETDRDVDTFSPPHVVMINQRMMCEIIFYFSPNAKDEEDPASFLTSAAWNKIS